MLRKPYEEPVRDAALSECHDEYADAARSQSGRRVVPVAVAAAALTVVSGVVYGHLSGRWREVSELADVGARLEEFPEAFGDWRMTRSIELSENVADTLQCAGYINGAYVNEITGQVVNVAVLVGPPGPMSVHTPEICFSSKQYDMCEERRRMLVSSEKSMPAKRGVPRSEIPDADRGESLWSVGFRTRDVHARPLHVYYGWNDGRGWEAAENPRFGFATAAYLYKAQVAVMGEVGGAGGEYEPGKQFLDEFLPELQGYLVSDPSERGLERIEKEVRF